MTFNDFINNFHTHHRVLYAILGYALIIIVVLIVLGLVLLPHLFHHLFKKKTESELQPPPQGASTSSLHRPPQECDAV